MSIAIRVHERNSKGKVVSISKSTIEPDATREQKIEFLLDIFDAYEWDFDLFMTAKALFDDEEYEDNNGVPYTSTVYNRLLDRLMAMD